MEMSVLKMCCDLLSISVLTIFDNNRLGIRLGFSSVVICFQFQFLRSLITTTVIEKDARFSCDLLSISVLTIFDNNYRTYTMN